MKKPMKKIKSNLSTVIFGMLVFSLGGCYATKKNLTTDNGTLAEGDRLADRDFFEEARKQYFRIKTEFPQSPLQVEADLRIADSYFKE
jgi:outer membrane protein assembly factor BamD (BamD/ComL family)